MEHARSSGPELADIVRKFGKGLIERGELSPMQVKALNNIVSCRTAELGWNEYACGSCGTVHYRYNSCGDRHCPKCQLSKQAEWVDRLMGETLPVKHFHIVFTAPHCLNDICLWDSRMYYRLLFRAAWDTLRSFGYSHYGSETGAVAVLHSWGRNLSLHPHIHCIVPAAGYSLGGEWRRIGSSGKYLYPVKQLSRAFRGALLRSISRHLKKKGMACAFSEQREQAHCREWVVHCEPAMTDASRVVEYLGHYTHRVAISNSSIVSIDGDKVTFMAKSYRTGGDVRPVVLDGEEFLRRFCMHVMPHRLVRIRRYGIYNHTAQRSLDLEFLSDSQKSAQAVEIKAETRQEKIKRITGIDITRCPSCKTGTLVLINERPRIRSPARNLLEILQSKLL